MTAPDGGVADARFNPELRAHLLFETVTLAYYAACAHVLVALAFAWLFWRHAPHAFLLGLLAVVTTIATAAWYGSDWCRARARGPGAVDRAIAISGWLACLLGTSWAAMPLMLYAPSDGDHRMLIVAICAGVISAAMVIGPILRNAVLFTTPLAAASFAALQGPGGEAGVGLSVLLAIYAGFVLFSSARIARLAVERILDRLRVEQQAATIGLLLRDFEAGASDWLWEVDEQLRLRHVSPRLAQAAGRAPSALAGTTLPDLLGGERGPGLRALLAILAARASFRDIAVQPVVDGAPRWWLLTGKPNHDAQGRFLGYRGVGSDITAARRSEAQIAQLARSDALTGVANRATLQEAVRQACAQATGIGPQAVLIYADLDGFKEINDRLGHQAGDRLLQEVASRLRAGAGAWATVGRLGGDEFALLVTGPAELADLTGFAARLIDQVSRPYLVDAMTVEIGVSLGLARTPQDATAAPVLLHCADLALYEAKSRGRRRFCLYDPQLGERAQARQSLLADLRHAQARGELRLEYQPVIRADGGLIDSWEALLRWHHPLRGRLSPTAFLPLAEAQGSIVQIGRWVLETACAEAAGWPGGSVGVGVNLSPAQFRSPDLIAQVRDALAASRLAPARLELEVSEAVLLDPTPATLQTLAGLRALGARIALDGFGIGYASLSHLLTFPFDRIKLDRSLVRELGRRDDHAALIEAVIGMAARTGMEVTAEGVETVDQATALRARGCRHLQGHLFSAPCPPAELRRLADGWVPFGGRLPRRLTPAGEPAGAGKAGMPV